MGKVNRPSPTALRQSSIVRAFTLLEVLLAVAIAAAMLALVLYFYQQAAATRTQILNETERVAAARLLMEHISTDLRTARPHEYLKVNFIGTTNSVEFLKTAFPEPPAWRSALEAVLRPPETDLHRVRYAFFTPADTNLGTVLGRAEEPFYGPPAAGAANQSLEVAITPEPTNQPANPFLPLSNQFHHISFRFFDGTNWLQNWHAPNLPVGVEVTIAIGEPAEGTETTENYPFEIYRRTIFLPGSRISLPGQSSAPPSTPAEDQLGLPKEAL